MKEMNWKKYFRLLFVTFLLAGACFFVTSNTVETQAAANGFRTVNGTTYYYKNGKMQKTGLTKIDGKYYYLHKTTGEVWKGWAKDSKGRYRYFNKKTGIMVTGWVVNSKDQYRYFSKSTGYMFQGWAKDSKGRYRYFNKSNGFMYRGWVKNSKGQYRYFAKGTGYMAQGWVKNSKGQYRYFYKDTGYMGTGWGQNSKGYRYFFKGTGIMATGLVTNSKGQHRFFNKSTGYMFQGLQKYGGYYYYFDENNGFRYEKGFKTIGKNTYYFNKNGRAQTGWLTLNGVKYYFNSKGVMYKGTTANIGGQEYNFGSNGAVISKLTASQKDVMKKILYAVETGGQVYGNADYADFTQAYTNSSAEHAITIGAGQWYATEAQRLLKLIRSTDPTTFNKYDKQYAKGALSKDLDSANWSTYNIKKTDVRAKAIVAIISSKSGIKCQDQLVYEQIEEYEDIITARYGAMSADAMMECINIIHQGGMGSLSRILNKTSKPYSAEKIYDTLCLDPYDTSSNNQVGDYTSRQKCVITWIRLYCK